MSAKEAVKKNLVDLIDALSNHNIQRIVEMCEQKGLITAGVSKELRDSQTNKSARDRASQLVSNLQTTIGLKPECLDTFLCILKDEKDVSCSTVAESIAKEYELQKLPKQEGIKEEPGEDEMDAAVLDYRMPNPPSTPPHSSTSEKQKLKTL